MTNEKDREEAREVVDTQGIKHIVLSSDTHLAEKVAEMCEYYVYESALSENELRIAIYRESVIAEAVKAEWERIGRRADLYLSDLLNSKLIKHDKGAMSGKNLKRVIDAILSDDQEAADECLRTKQ